jgi:hypothetical protein
MADAAREQQKPGETRQQWALRNMTYYAAQGNNREAQSYANVAGNFSMQEASSSSASPVALDIGKLEADVRQEKKTLTVVGFVGGGLIVGAAAAPEAALCVGWGGAGYSVGNSISTRALDNQTSGQIVAGTVYDFTGVTGFGRVTYGTDPATGKYMPVPYEDKGWVAGMSGAQAIGSVAMTTQVVGAFRSPSVQTTLGRIWSEDSGSLSLPWGGSTPENFVSGEYPPGMGAYKDVGGHHPLSGRAFDYENYYDAMSIGQQTMRSNGWGHPQPLTSFQQQGYLAFGQTGEPLSIFRMSAIEVDAMVQGNIPAQFAKQAASAAIWERITNGQFTPTQIPWVGPNPGVKP